MEDDAFEDEQRRQNFFVRLLVFILLVVPLLVCAPVILAWNFVAWVFMAFAQVLCKCGTYATSKAMEVPGLICKLFDHAWDLLAWIFMSLQVIYNYLVWRVVEISVLIRELFARAWHFLAWVFVHIVHLRTRASDLLAWIFMSLQAGYKYLVTATTTKLMKISSKVKELGRSTNRLLVRAWNIILLGRNQQVIFQFGAPSVAIVPRDEAWEASRVLGGSSRAWKALVAQNNVEDDWMFQTHGIELYEYTLKVAAREEQAGK